MPMKLSHLAKCLKILEELKWAIPAGLLDDKSKVLKHHPKEYSLISDLPCCSAFCYMFRPYKMQSADPENSFNCFCPRYNKGNNCGFNKNGKRKPEFQILDEVKSISIPTIMKYLKKLPLSKHQEKLRKFQSLWYINVRFMTDEWKSQPNCTVEVTDLED